MKKNILSMAALLMASAAVFTACSSDDNITGEQPANPTGKYTMTINASKGGDATTRALSLGRNDANTKNVLNATWDANEEVLVYQGGSKIGTLYSAASATNETTLTGTLDSAPDAGQDLTLYFHTNATPSYAGQDGTLATIASTYDFCAPATITAGSFTVSGSTVSTNSSASFGANQQAIVKFTLTDKTTTSAISATQLVVTDGTSTISLTSIPAATYTANGADNVLYVAFPAAGTAKTITLTATVGSDTYTYETASAKTFTNGSYYEITVKMTKVTASKALTSLTSSEVGWRLGSDGKAYEATGDLPTGVTAVAMIAYVGSDNGEASPYNHGLALATSDANGGNTCQWKTSQSSAGHTTQNNSSFTSESGLQYNATHNTDEYPAFKAAIANNGTAVPTCCSAWFLASAYQWSKMGNAAGGLSTLKTNAGMQSSVYWSSSEYSTLSAWEFGSSFYSANKTDNDRVRSCLAF